ncbi:MAG: hypothetical protein RLY20_493 [Verrucomicrobiota bacterium]|jgi:hypothetical protein
MLTSHELLGFMSPSLADEILNWTRETERATYKATLQAVAEARKLRLVFLERQPRPQRHATMVAALNRPNLEMVASTLLRTWLVKRHKDMLVDFLNALGIQHEDGVVEGLPETMDNEKLKAAVELLLGKYPHEAVGVYLNAFNDMNEANWPNLKELLEGDSRLQLGQNG